MAGGFRYLRKKRKVNDPNTILYQVLTQQSLYFDYTGSDQYWTVPTGVSEIILKAWGNPGGSTVGGSGAYITGAFNVTSGQQVKMIIGGGGFSGYPTDYAASAVPTYAISSSDLGLSGLAAYSVGGGLVAAYIANELSLVAGSGGGGFQTYYGGAGGDSTGGAGGNFTSPFAYGGTQSAGGTIQGSNIYPLNDGESGGFLYGGRARRDDAASGGYGYYGGAGGAYVGTSGGGGGSSYVGGSKFKAGTKTCTHYSSPSPNTGQNVVPNSTDPDRTTSYNPVAPYATQKAKGAGEFTGIMYNNPGRIVLKYSPVSTEAFKPSGVTVTQGNTGEVSVSCTPVVISGVTITSYTAIASTGQIASRSSLPVTVTGLETGTPVTFRIKATSGNKHSAYSDPSASITPSPAATYLGTRVFNNPSNYSGASTPQTIVPPTATRAIAKVWGAGAQGDTYPNGSPAGTGGNGGFMDVEFAVTGGETLRVAVGTAGSRDGYRITNMPSANNRGGGDGFGNGGGFTGIFRGASAETPIVIAGGGGYSPINSGFTGGTGGYPSGYGTTGTNATQTTGDLFNSATVGAGGYRVGTLGGGGSSYYIPGATLRASNTGVALGGTTDADYITTNGIYGAPPGVGQLGNNAGIVNPYGTGLIVIHYFSGAGTAFTPASKDNYILPIETDPYSNSVSLLMHMNGLNNGTTFSDQTGKVITNAGGVITSTEQLMFGTSSAKFAGTGGLTTTIPTIGTGDFTIEFWMYKPVAGNNTLISIGNAWYTAGNIYLLSYSNKFALSVGAVYFADGGVEVLNRWDHYAVVRSGSTVTLYINGVSVKTLSSAANITATTCYIGVANTWSSYTGYIDELRVTSGVARYLTNFQVPVQEFALNP